VEDRVIAGYRVIGRLGAGGMGEVFLVQHPRLPRHDALKLLDPGISRRDDFAARFQREADLLAPLSHQNITTVYDRGEFEGRFWLTMEYVDGTDAARLLQRSGPMPVPLALDVLAGAAAGLDYAYQRRGITHRDVKPANILVGFHNGVLSEVKIADFGIAKARDRATPITSTGMTIGTVHYMSPEAIDGNSPDNRADEYSLACTAFELLTGSPPYTDETMSAQMSAHFNRPPPRITERRADLPSGFDPIFAKALAKRPADRYATSGEFVTALQSAARRAGTPATRGSTVAAPTSTGLPMTGPQSRPATVPGTAPEPTGLWQPEPTGMWQPEPTGVWQPEPSRVRPQTTAAQAGAAHGHAARAGTAPSRPIVSAPPVAPRVSDQPRTQALPGTTALPELGAPEYISTPPTQRARWRRLVFAAAAALLVLAMVLVTVLWQSGGSGLGGGGEAGVHKLTATDATLVDFSGSPDSSRNLGNVLTGEKPAWHTATYYSGPGFGNLKSGLGIMITLDGDAQVTDGVITSPSAGSTVQVRTASSDSIGSLDSTTQIWSGQLDGDSTSFTASDAPRTRYVLVWISGLAGSGQSWSTTISHITLRGK
jgi:serine/threonine protein kinase